MRELGTMYIKTEFRAHNHLFPSNGELKEQDAKYSDKFIHEWNSFLDHLNKNQNGKHIGIENLNKFSDEQIGQLYVLKEETISLKGK